MTHAATSTEPTRDDRLAIVLDALLKQQAAGQSIDYDAVGREHPDLVAEIKQLLTVGQMIDFVRNTPTMTQSLAGSASDGGMSPSLALPANFGEYDLLEEIGRG